MIMQPFKRDRQSKSTPIRLYLNGFSVEESVVCLYKENLGICRGQHKLQDSIAIQIIL